MEDKTMRVAIKRISFLFCGVSCLMSLWSVSAFGAERPLERNGPIESLDDRYHHGHYYVPRGTVVRELPAGYRPYWFHGTHLYFSGGVWYAPGPNGFIVTRPPTGLVVSTLPPFYTTVWIGGVPYYYANDVYYRWVPEQNGYEVVEPPQGADQPGPPPQSAAEDFYIYPKNGQSPEQQSADRYECHSWAKSQTGFDPTKLNGGVPPGDTAAKREQYRRAITACLEARGYSVK
jgi:hypothetical protein